MPIENYIVVNDATEVFDSNVNVESVHNVEDPILLAKQLHQLILNLKGQNLMDDNEIDYKHLVQSDLFKKNFCLLANQLKQISLDELLNSADEEQNDINLLSFFINVYNTLTIHSIAYLYITEFEKNANKKAEFNILDQVAGKFWSRMAYKIDKYIFSLDDIEHGILRANRPHPTSRLRMFDNSDMRSKYTVKHFDCRIHFALNCGARGCPPIQFYTPANLKRGLDLASKNFCTSETEVNVDKLEITTSRLFSWYRNDFISQNENDVDKIGTKEQDVIIIKFIGSQLSENNENYSKFQTILNMGKLDKMKLNYSSYNWTMNIKN